LGSTWSNLVDVYSAITSGIAALLPQIYDVMKFMSLVANEFQRLPVNVKRIQMLSMVNFSFVHDTAAIYDTPCWINIINLAALDLLSNKTGYLRFLLFLPFLLLP